MQSVMKFVLFMLMTVFATAFTTVPARAQSGSWVQIDIPFDFSVGNTTLKAGNYRVQELQSGILAFANDGQEHKFALTVACESANRSHQPKLVFSRYGDEAFLNKVFLSGDSDCHQLSRSSREKKLIQKPASGEELSLLVQPAR